jgi:hypothetical protein
MELSELSISTVLSLRFHCHSSKGHGSHPAGSVSTVRGKGPSGTHVHIFHPLVIGHNEGTGPDGSRTVSIRLAKHLLSINGEPSLKGS